MDVMETEGKKDHCNKTVDIYEDVSSPEVTPENFGKPLTCWYRFRSFRGTPKDWILRIKFNKFKVGSLLNASHCQGGYMQAYSQTRPRIGFTVATLNEEERGCAADHKLDPEEIQKAFDEHLKLVEGNERINKYLECVFKKYYFINEKGEIDDVLIALLAKQLILRSHGVDDMDEVESSVLKECQGVAHDPKEIAVKVHNCIIHEALKYGDGENVGKYTPDEECLTELKLDRKVAEAVEEEAYKKLPEGDDQLNKYMNCLWKHYDWLNENGIVDSFAIRSFIKYRVLSALGLHNYEDTSKKIAKTCYSIQGSDLGDSTVKVYNCVADSALKSK